MADQGARSGRRWPHPRRSGFSAIALALLSIVINIPAASALEVFGTKPLDLFATAISSLDRHDLAALSLTLGLVAATVVTAILLLRTRSRAADAAAKFRDERMALKAEVDRVHALLLSEPQIIVSWAAAADDPDILGDASLIGSISGDEQVIAYDTWLDPEHAQAMQRAIEALRTCAQSFSMALTTLSGRPIEAEGRAVGGRAILRLKDVGGLKGELAEIGARHQKLLSNTEALRTLVEALPSPVWARTGNDLVLVNPAYANAVEASDAADAIARGLELLDRAARDESVRVRAAGLPYAGRLPAVVAGRRRTFDILDVPTRTGSAGIGVDVTEVESLRAELSRMVDAHRRTLDQLATGVAIFATNQILTFYNAAYRALWDLDAAFLDQGPTDSAVLDKLRSGRKLPEETDFRAWKDELHEAYRATETQEHVWHLPDGRTLRVVTTPNPEGGVTYIFDDVTERLQLARRYDALIRVQGETLDNLAEAVAVFGSDGRVRLSNPAFERMWKLATEMLAQRPHIEAVIAWCRMLHQDDPFWHSLRAAITGIEQREAVSKRLERRDGSVVDCATVPLPDGATLVTFQDVTDTVNVERVLRERNEALEAADELKIDFVHHVSYELRSPLTNVIGFAHFLGDPSAGPLTEKQREYLSYITASSNALLAIINDILDLATIDAGAMTLSLGPVDIGRCMNAAAEGIRDRLVKDTITLDIRAPANLGTFVADERRLRQVFFNLLSNAIGFSPAGGTVTLSADRRDDAIVFAVTDNGPGIPAEMKDRVFGWFESHSLGSQHRGAGLGLSLVRSFVELHGGSVRLDSTPGQGTTVICHFPLDQAAERSAA
jgi:signal transduction histidine kinase